MNKYLSQIRYRAMLLFPPLVIFILGAIVACLSNFIKISLVMKKSTLFMVYGGAIWMMIGVLMIIWHDYKQSVSKITHYE